MNVCLPSSTASALHTSLQPFLEVSNGHTSARKKQIWVVMRLGKRRWKEGALRTLDGPQSAQLGSHNH